MNITSPSSTHEFLDAIHKHIVRLYMRLQQEQQPFNNNNNTSNNNFNNNNNIHINLNNNSIFFNSSISTLRDKIHNELVTDIVTITANFNTKHNYDRHYRIAKQSLKSGFKTLVRLQDYVLNCAKSCCLVLQDYMSDKDNILEIIKKQQFNATTSNDELIKSNVMTIAMIVLDYLIRDTRVLSGINCRLTELNKWWDSNTSSINIDIMGIVLGDGQDDDDEARSNSSFCEEFIKVLQCANMVSNNNNNSSSVDNRLLFGSNLLFKWLSTPYSSNYRLPLLLYKQHTDRRAIHNTSRFNKLNYLVKLQSMFSVLTSEQVYQVLTLCDHCNNRHLLFNTRYYYNSIHDENEEYRQYYLITRYLIEQFKNTVQNLSSSNQQEHKLQQSINNPVKLTIITLEQWINHKDANGMTPLTALHYKPDISSPSSNSSSNSSIVTIADCIKLLIANGAQLTSTSSSIDNSNDIGNNRNGYKYQKNNKLLRIHNSRTGLIHRDIALPLVKKQQQEEQSTDGSSILFKYYSTNGSKYKSEYKQFMNSYNKMNRKANTIMNKMYSIPTTLEQRNTSNSSMMNMNIIDTLFMHLHRRVTENKCNHGSKLEIDRMVRMIVTISNYSTVFYYNGSPNNNNEEDENEQQQDGDAIKYYTIVNQPEQADRLLKLLSERQQQQVQGNQQLQQKKQQYRQEMKKQYLSTIDYHYIRPIITDCTSNQQKQDQELLKCDYVVNTRGTINTLLVPQHLYDCISKQWNLMNKQMRLVQMNMFKQQQQQQEKNSNHNMRDLIVQTQN